MRSGFADHAVFNHDDIIRVADGGKPVRDDENRLLAAQAVDRLANQLLRLVIDGRRRLVENQHRRVAQKRPRDGDTLLLSARKPRPAFADNRLIPIRHFADERVRPRRLCGPNHRLIRRVRRAVADIIHDGAVKEEHILQHDGVIAAQAADFQIANIRAVHEDAAAVHVVEALQQRNDGRLARARRADNRRHRPRFRGEGNVAQHALFVVRVAEGHVFKLDFTLAAPEINRVRLFLHVRLRVEHLQHALTRSDGALHILRKPPQRRQRRVEKRKIHEKAHDIRRRKLAAQRERAADGGDEHRAERREKLDGRVIDAVGEIRMNVHAPVFLAHFRHALMLARFGGKGLNLLHAGDMILHVAAERAEKAVVDLEQRAHLARIERADIDHERHGDQRDRGQKRVDGEEHRRNADDDHQV